MGECVSSLDPQDYFVPYACSDDYMIILEDTPNPSVGVVTNHLNLNLNLNYLWVLMPSLWMNSEYSRSGDAG